MPTHTPFPIRRQQRRDAAIKKPDLPREFPAPTFSSLNTVSPACPMSCSVAMATDPTPASAPAENTPAAGHASGSADLQAALLARDDVDEDDADTGSLES